MNQNEYHEFDWACSLNKAKRKDEIPDHIVHEATLVSVEIDLALRPILNRVNISVFMNALNAFYYTHILYDLFRGDANSLEKEIPTLMRIHEENLKIIVSNNRRLMQIIEDEEKECDG